MKGKENDGVTIKIRDIDKVVITKLDEEARRLGLSRSELIVQKMDTLALTGMSSVPGEFDRMAKKVLDHVTINVYMREKIYEFFPELQVIHQKGGS